MAKLSACQLVFDGLTVAHVRSAAGLLVGQSLEMREGQLCLACLPVSSVPAPLALLQLVRNQIPTPPEERVSCLKRGVAYDVCNSWGEQEGEQKRQRQQRCENSEAAAAAGKAGEYQKSPQHVL